MNNNFASKCNRDRERHGEFMLAAFNDLQWVLHRLKFVWWMKLLPLLLCSFFLIFLLKIHHYLHCVRTQTHTSTVQMKWLKFVKDHARKSHQFDGIVYLNGTKTGSFFTLKSWSNHSGEVPHQGILRRVHFIFYSQQSTWSAKFIVPARQKFKMNFTKCVVHWWW